MSVTEVTDDSFNTDVLQQSGLILVDFWAEWCGPCKMLMPIVEEVASEKADILRVVKVNVDHHQETPSKYGVRSIPTLMLFKDGQLLATKTGVMPKSSLIDWINAHA